MKTIKVEKLTKENFSPFGCYYDYANPDGYSLNGAIHSFFPDRITSFSNGLLGFSPIQVNKPDQMIISQVEYHTTTAELIMPLDDDMIIHVAQPSAGKPIPEHTKAFLVPKNTLVKLNACVWHLAPLPANNERLTALIILPECTYINDCIVVDLAPEQQFVIEK